MKVKDKQNSGPSPQLQNMSIVEELQEKMKDLTRQRDEYEILFKN